MSYKMMGDRSLKTENGSPKCEVRHMNWNAVEGSIFILELSKILPIKATIIHKFWLIILTRIYYQFLLMKGPCINNRSSFFVTTQNNK